MRNMLQEIKISYEEMKEKMAKQIAELLSVRLGDDFTIIELTSGEAGFIMEDNETNRGEVTIEMNNDFSYSVLVNNGVVAGFNAVDDIDYDVDGLEEDLRDYMVREFQEW